MNHGFADADEDREGKVNRSRIKIGGTLFTPQFDYYTEHAIPSNTFLAFTSVSYTHLTLPTIYSV